MFYKKMNGALWNEQYFPHGLFVLCNVKQVKISVVKILTFTMQLFISAVQICKNLIFMIFKKEYVICMKMLGKFTI